MYCVCTIFMQVFWSLCLYCVYKHRMPLTVVQFVHMHSHLVATKPLIGGCKHLSFQDSQHTCSRCLSCQCMPYLQSKGRIEKPGLADRHQVCAMYVSFLQTSSRLPPDSDVENIKGAKVSVPNSARFLFQRVLGFCSN